MADTFGVQLIGERRVALRFDRFPEAARQGLLDVVTKYQSALFQEISNRIPVRTGALKASLTGGVENGPTKVRGWVNVAGRDPKLIRQAQALEYGSKGYARAGKGRQKNSVEGAFSGPGSSIQQVSGRTGGIVALRFLRGPLAEQATAFINDATQAVKQATEQA